VLFLLLPGVGFQNIDIIFIYINNQQIVFYIKFYQYTIISDTALIINYFFYDLAKNVKTLQSFIFNF
jgi:hypothetical protein